MLKISEVSKSFNKSTFRDVLRPKTNTQKKQVLKRISFDLERGDSLGIMGKNGSGKSTLLRIISGLITPDHGEIILEGKIITNAFHEKDIKINLVSSNERSLFWRLSLEENLKFFCSLYGEDSSKKNEKINSLLEYFDLQDKKKDRVMHLSSGDKKALIIVRSLIPDNQILLYDEISSSLDIPRSEKLVTYLNEEIEKKGISIIWVSHSQNEIDLLCNKKYFLSNGSLTLK